MSTNKQQLQLNNTDLQSILSTVLGLPTQESVKHGAYVWKKFTAQGGDFVDFAVSNSESAYPDGGTQDGYWYERTGEIDVPKFGFSNVAVDKVKFSSRTALNTAISHSLGITPKLVIVVVDPSGATSNSTWDLLSAIYSPTWYTSSNKSYKGGMFANSTTGVLSLDSSRVTLSSKTVTLYNYDTFYFKANVEYTLITAA